MRRLAQIQGVEDVEVRVEDVDRYTSAANAYTTGLGPSRKVFLWNTLLDGRFRDDEVRAVTAHEFGHQSQNHLWKAIAWYALFAVPGAWAIARITRRRGGMRRPEAVPLSLLALAVLSFVALPLQNVISRHMEQEADWEALETTRDPDAVTGLFQSFSRDEPRRSHAARLGIRPARHASAAARPHRDGAGVEGPKPRRHAAVRSVTIRA